MLAIRDLEIIHGVSLRLQRVAQMSISIEQRRCCAAECAAGLHGADVKKKSNVHFRRCCVLLSEPLVRRIVRRFFAAPERTALRQYVAEESRVLERDVGRAESTGARSCNYRVLGGVRDSVTLSHPGHELIRDERSKALRVCEILQTTWRCAIVKKN